MYVAIALVILSIFISVKATKQSKKKFKKEFKEDQNGDFPGKPLEIRYQGRFYDVTDFVKKHPGGAIIEFYVNNEEDATEAIQQFHHRSAKKVEAILKSLKSRPISEGELSREKNSKYEKLTEDFNKLYEEFKAEGLFEPNHLYAAMRIVEIILIGSLGLTMVAFSGENILGILAGSLTVGVFMIRAGFLMHEFGHHSMTGSPKWDRLLEEIVFGLGTGLSGCWWRSQHNRHHAMPQRLQHDVDLQTAPLMAHNVAVVEDESHVNFFIRHQAKLYLPFYAFVGLARWKFYLHPRYAFFKKQYHELALMFLHYVIAYCTLGLGPYIISTAFIATALNLTFALSHSHLPVTDEPRHWVEYSLVHSMDIDSSPFIDWWTGYLNYQIEHHLFPTMPHFRHAKTWRRVRALALKHHLPYLKTSYGTALKSVFTNLSQVSKELESREKKAMVLPN